MEKTFTILLVFVCIVMSAPYPASAHDGEDHSTPSYSEADLRKMELLVDVLTKLTLVLTEYKTQYPNRPLIAIAPAAVVAAPADSTHHEEVDHEDAGDTHGEEASSTEEHIMDMESSTEHSPALSIEIEPHYGKTHVHVRYMDKPEEMFFVDAAIGDEEAIVADIVEKTGLSESEIRPALKYNN